MKLPAELQALEQSIGNLLEESEEELEKITTERQREQEIQNVEDAMRERLTKLFVKAESALAHYQKQGIATPIKTKLEEQIEQLKIQIENIPLLAIQSVDEQLLRVENENLKQSLENELSQWRHDLKEDLIEMLEEQENFFDATDCAIAIKGYVEDLKAIDALPTVVNALLKRINDLSTEGSVAKLRDTHESTLRFIVTKAQENRNSCLRQPVKLSVNHRKIETQPNHYKDLSGKVVVFGGHTNLVNIIRGHLRQSSVALTWCSALDRPNMEAQACQQVANADIVVIITSFIAHRMEGKASQACEQAGKQPILLHSHGVSRTLETIAVGLQTHKLTKYRKRS